MSKFEWMPEDVKISQCAFCSNKLHGKICKAFLNGIPDEILNNQFDHRNAYSGDNGIQFEANDGVDISDVDRLFE